MELKDFLKRKPSISVRLLRGSLFGLALSYGLYGAVQTLPDQEFTDREKDTLTEVFQDSIDIEQINFHRSPLGDNILAMLNAEGAVLGDTMIISTRYRNTDQDYIYILRHEGMHIWQGQNRSFNFFHNLIDEAAHFFDSPIELYSYTLDKDKDLLDYNHEQQASIIADYYNVLEGRHSLFLENPVHDKEERIELFQSVLKDFLADPNFLQSPTVKPIGLGV